MDAELGKWTVNRALSNADKLVWPVTIGTLESSGTYQQTLKMLLIHYDNKVNLLVINLN
jgi:hypothetical protein